MNTAITELLHEYPLDIFNKETELADYLVEKQSLLDRMALFSAECELEIAENPIFRNESMRKAQKVISLSNSKDYQELVLALKTLEGRISRLQLLTEHRKREFSVIKLERKLEIAKLGS